ncbi:tryptophan synthase subunit alpha [Neobacillus dielmonensis]|uniref:tryptophan synthase subunit alpha n=1 Tax=Neobacillus dielmonensis TaxID=1347369 RepID=UPI0005AB0898|nr:tryptophan synthase subunit alpha [Neobacillus dielmonensis]
MNRITQAFRRLTETNGKAFIPYIMAGDGGLSCLVERLQLLERLDATAVEVGVPFSDPVADGPTIQQAGIRALKDGTSLNDILVELTKAKANLHIPIILMTYLNPIYSYGINRFVEAAQTAGIDGCIIPDLPIEEEEIIAPQLAEAGIELIRLVTPTTPIKRVEEISNRGNGFLYTVTVKGITGARGEFDGGLSTFLSSVKQVSPIPVVAGFGISNNEQIAEMTKYCDGVVVGSKIVDLLSKNRLEELEDFMSAYKKSSANI